MIKVSTFCSGIGAAEQAIKELNVLHKVVFAAEIDKYARMTYEANHEAELMINDMCEPNYIGEQYYADLNISGLPCQAFSLAGKRLGELDKRGLLFYDFYRYVKNQQPKVFIIENVKGLLSQDNGKTFQNWLQLLGRSLNTMEQLYIHEDSLEYNLHYQVLNSKDFGVPQNRERIFIVGIRKDLPNNFRFPIGWKLDKRLRDILETEVDEKYYLSEKMIENLTKVTGKENTFPAAKISDGENIASCLTARSHKMEKADNYINVNKIGFINQDTQASQVYDTNGISPTLSAGTHGYAQGYISEPKIHQKSRGFNKGGLHDICPPITSNSFEQNNVLAEPQLKQIAQIDGFESEGRIYDSNGLARTIKNGGGGGSKTGWYEVGEFKQRIRRLTPLEVFRLQAYPDEFFYKAKAVNSDTQLYKQAGNTITVSVIKSIINNLIHIINK